MDELVGLGGSHGALNILFFLLFHDHLTRLDLMFPLSFRFLLLLPRLLSSLQARTNTDLEESVAYLCYLSQVFGEY